MITKIKGIVIKWKQLGRIIWFKTANISYKNDFLEDAVYKINIIIDWKINAWAWCYRKNLNIFESHIFDFNEDIYWKEIEIIILEKIRNNIKVNSIEELKSIISNDINKIKGINYNVLTFWTFDLVHKWHIYYLNESKKYWNKLITIVATDKNIEKIKWNLPKYKLDERINHLSKLNICDEIVWWDENNPLKWIQIYNPQIICLWYDQEWFSKLLFEYIKNNNLEIEIIRIPPYKKDIYKSSILKKKF